MNFQRHSGKKGMSVPEVMIAAAISSIVMAGLIGSYQVLQRGFAFSVAWTSARTAQTRVLHSMALDLRNAVTITTSTSSTPFLTLKIPNRYSSYESSGARSGDPERTATRVVPVVSGSTGELTYSQEFLTIEYSRNENEIDRKASWKEGGTAVSASRTVGVFPEAVSISFLNSAGTAYDPATDLSITPVITAKIKTHGAAQEGDIVLTDTIFLRAKAHR